MSFFDYFTTTDGDTGQIVTDNENKTPNGLPTAGKRLRTWVFFKRRWRKFPGSPAAVHGLSTEHLEAELST